MKYPVNRSAQHAFASIGHGRGGADDNSSRRRTAKTQSKADDIGTIFHIGKKTMTRLRKLAEKDPITDPWEGDLTNPAQFAQWYWGKRRELQSQFPDS